MKFHFWYVAFSLFFGGLIILGYDWLSTTGRLDYGVTPEDIILISLAVMRLVRLFTYDKITKFIRDWFVGAHPESFMGTLGALLDCPWCTGLWFAAFTVFLYFAWDGAWYFILILAIGAVASFFQVLSNLIGWHAEYKKRETERL
ncbi:MAG TPA: DUF1360 domain-containing protein [Candidatus Paceibacterota bacterium]|nr:DUF1360 domain-containing protein [Candidatus Paceibacterota bacterium]